MSDQPKTKTALFVEALEKYPDAETAKSHIPEIAEKLECTTALGRKALTRTKFFKEAAAEIHAEVPTVKISEVKPEEIPLEAPEAPTEGAAPAEIAAPEAAAPPIIPSDDEVLKPIFNRSLGKLINDTLINKLLKIKEKIADQQMLDDFEVLLLINLKRFAGIALTGDNLLYATDITFGAGFATDLILAWKEKRDKAEAERLAREEREAREKAEAKAKETEKPIEPQPEEPKTFKKGETTPKWALTGSPLEEEKT